MNNSVSDDMIARAQNGSPADAGGLYLCFHLSIYRYLYYRTGNSQTAEDLTSEVFLKMVRALPSYRVGTVPFQAWLFQIARNMAIDHYRRNQHYLLVELDENLDGDDPGLENLIDLNLTSVDLVEGLKNIEETQRDVLLLRFIEGMAIKDTAAVLHKSIDSVKALQRRGLLALKKMLNHLEMDHDGSQ